MIIEKVVSYIVSIFLLIHILYIVYFNCVRFHTRWKCRKKHYNECFNRCHEENCKWAKYCDYYECTPTKEEIVKIKKILEDFQTQIKEKP